MRSVDAPFRLTLADIDVRHDERMLFVDGNQVALGGRAFDVLVALLEHRDRTVSKNELIDRVWPNLVVEENNLQVQVSALRKILGGHAILTIPGRGYKLALAPAPSADGAAAQSSAPQASRATPASTEIRPSPTNLQRSLAPLYGRGDDVAAIGRLLKLHAMVSVVGAGGIGKTRLAQAAASECAAVFPDGVWWIELASLSDPELVPTTVGRVLGVAGSDGRTPLQTLQQVLAAQQTLLVLDNCEHVADAVADVVDAIVSAAPGVHVLVTSQEPLRSAHEHLYRLGPLPTPAANDPFPEVFSGAAQLFVERARAIDARFEPNPARWSSIGEICRRLDGIPLAIEMAAARLPLLGLEGLRERLDERFKILTGNSRTVLRRHQTLRATLDWSHSLLSPAEQTVLRRLGVFAGTFSLVSAEQVAGDAEHDGWATLDHLGALVDKSLVLAEGNDEPRYRLLETTRAYALERLGDAGETSTLLHRHAEALRDLLLERERRARAVGAADRQAMAAELDNLRAALAWACSDGAGSALAIEIASLSMPIWQAAVALREGIDTLIGLAPRIDERTPDLVQARFWKTLGRLGTVGARRECFEAAGRAAALYRSLGDVDNLYEALIAVAAIGAERGDSGAAEALAEAQRIEHEGLAPRLRGGMAWARQRWLNRADRIEEALQAVLLQAEFYRREGLEAMAAMAEGANVAACEVNLGRPHSAEARARQALVVMESHGASRDAGHVRSTLVLALTNQGRHAEAIDEARRALPLLLAEGDEFRLFEPLALNAAMQGRVADATRVLGYADRHRADNGAVRTPAQQRLRDRADALVAAQFDQDARTALVGAGAKMSHIAAFAVAVGDVSDPID